MGKAKISKNWRTGKRCRNLRADVAAATGERPMSASGDIPKRLVIAIGGNATHPEGIRGTPSEQIAVAADLGQALLPVMELGNELIITHGNGPVVGKILMRQ